MNALMAATTMLADGNPPDLLDTATPLELLAGGACGIIVALLLLVVATTAFDQKSEVSNVIKWGGYIVGGLSILSIIYGFMGNH